MLRTSIVSICTFQLRKTAERSSSSSFNNNSSLSYILSLYSHYHSHYLLLSYVPYIYIVYLIRRGRPFPGFPVDSGGLCIYNIQNHISLVLPCRASIYIYVFQLHTCMYFYIDLLSILLLIFIEAQIQSLHPGRILTLKSR